ncbi:MAG: hypothetical protein AAFP04_14535 [Myxococcota bacterium]
MAERSLHFDAIVVGGSALALLGVTDRQTRDFDILDPELPDGWRRWLQVAFTGTSLTLATLGRADLLKTKLFALCDRGTDLANCIAMAPTTAELADAEPWLAEQDAKPMWPDHVRATLDDLRGRLGHGV